MQEYWINVFEYKTIKDRQFYSHYMGNIQSLFHIARRQHARPDCKCVYRIHVKVDGGYNKPKINIKFLTGTKRITPWYQKKTDNNWT